MNPVRNFDRQGSKIVFSNGVKRSLIALQFLTVLPIKIKSEIRDEDFGRSLLYFPIIGLFIGLLLSTAMYLLSFLPHLVIGALILTISIIITGGIHLDGFADTCDGFYGARSKERILEIMHDSHIGVMGVVGIVILLLLKFALIVNIPREGLWRSLIMMAVFSRWSQGYACLASQYARREGKAKSFIEYADGKDIFIGGLFTLIAFLILANLEGFIFFTLTFILIFLFTNYIKRRIGGMTGDTIGATNEIAEIGVLLFSLIWL